MPLQLPLSLLAAGVLTTVSGASSAPGDIEAYIQTSEGDIVMTLNDEKSPASVVNFIRYVNNRFYDGTIFHRVVKDFVIQGGGFNVDMQKKLTQDPIRNESDNGLKNLRGTVSMARTNDPDSATSQFFINLKDNSFLDYTPGQWGYSVFGRVVKGMDVVDKIANIPVGSSGDYQDVPTKAVVIKGVRVYEVSEPPKPAWEKVTEKIKAWFSQD